MTKGSKACVVNASCRVQIATTSSLCSDWMLIQRDLCVNIFIKTWFLFFLMQDLREKNWKAMEAASAAEKTAESKATAATVSLPNVTSIASYSSLLANQIIQGGHSPGKRWDQSKIRGKYFWWKSQRKVREFHEKLLKSGKNEIAFNKCLRKCWLRTFYFHILSKDKELS